MSKSTISALVALTVFVIEAITGLLVAVFVLGLIVSLLL